MDDENYRNTIDAMKNIGLNLYERQIYAALLKHGFATSSQLCQTTNVPRPRTYDVLQSLEQKGFAKPMHSKPKRYAAIHPNDAMQNAKDNIEEKYKLELEKINKFSQTKELQALARLYDAKSSKLDDATAFNTLKNKNDFKKTFKSMLECAKKQICIITTQQGLANIEKYFSSLKKTAKRGVKIRIIAPITEENIESAKKIAETANLKNLTDFDKNKFNGTLVLMDNKESIISISDENKFSVKSPLLWMRSEHFCQNFAKTNFELMWKQLEELDN